MVAAHSEGSFKTKAAIVFFGTLGGALPDLDAISYWSKFDSTIGQWLGLAHSGREIYGAKLWYSHHAALHSLSAALALPFLFLCFKGIWQFIKERQVKALVSCFQKGKLPALAFSFGFCMHLLEDMPTPASVWGGVNLFWPSESYVGGFGKIWWWNNYDIFLLIVSVILVNLLWLSLSSWLKKKAAIATKVTFCLGLALIVYQMNSRPVDFSYTGHTDRYAEMEKQSKQIQEDILGEKLYSIMERFDRFLPMYF